MLPQITNVGTFKFQQKLSIALKDLNGLVEGSNRLVIDIFKYAHKIIVFQRGTAILFLHSLQKNVRLALAN